jgi:hypothetical protein
MAEETMKVVRAEKFELVDSIGNVRAHIGTEEDAPEIRLFDKEGKTCAIIGLIEDEYPFFRINVGNGKAGLSAFVDKRDDVACPTLELHDSKGDVGVRLHLSEHGPSLVFFDKGEKPRAMLRLLPEYGASLALYDPEGKKGRGFESDIDEILKRSKQEEKPD